MTEFLVKHFVKDYKDVEKVSVRTAYGVLASIVGIFCNVFLFAVKFTVGLVLGSVSVTADAFNNLSDAGSSVIGFVGVKMAEKPADADHPFGHGRMEYIAALVVSFLVIEVGFTFLKDSVGRIRNPEEMSFSAVSVCILLLSIAVKLWLGLFNRKLGERIDSKVMKAVFTDAMGDVVTTGATIFSLVFFGATGINIDGFVGAGVALVVMWAGIGIARDTLEPPNNVDIERSHEIIDRIERDAGKNLGIFLVIHMDPIETRDESVLEIRQRTAEILDELDPACSLHDFRVVPGEGQVNLIFDMVIPIEYDEKMRKELPRRLAERVKEIDPRYQCVITVDYDYVAKTTEE